MTRTFVKSIAAAGAVAGLMLCSAGVALPAGTPPGLQDPRKAVKPVLFFNQSILLAQGLSPQVAIARARRFAPYPFSSVHYVPAGFQLVIVRMFPYIPNTLEPQDTETFMKLSAARKPSSPHAKAAAVPAFELDHQFGSPYSYANGDAYFTVNTAKVGGRTVSVAEQKHYDLRIHKSVDLVYVYWYDRKSKVATEVNAELVTSGLSRAAVLQIAASVS